MNKLDTLNEKEQREAVYAALKAEGIEVTKTLVDILKFLKLKKDAG